MIRGAVVLLAGMSLGIVVGGGAGLAIGYLMGLGDVLEIDSEMPKSNVESTATEVTTVTEDKGEVINDGGS